MSKSVLAIASCRVSSDEQRLNNSLSRQHQNVIKASEELNAPIVRYWSESMSSKRGTNLKRRDINEMIDYCKKNKRVKYLIVDEPDRFMRSIDEAAYFEVTFRELGVTVWYASDSDLNKGNLASKLLKFTKYYSAEGSNEERQVKSIAGQTAALKAGFYPYVPKSGYKRGATSGVPEIHPVRGPALKEVLIRIAEHRVTPTKGLIELNNSDYMQERSHLKMDKFRKIATDPFYAGIVEMNKQVKVRNEEGRHIPLISIEQHKELIRIFDDKKKNQLGPRKNGNPEYPLNIITAHESCLELKNKGKFVGYNHGNGKNPNLVYKKYRCRSCGLNITRDELHEKVSMIFDSITITKSASKNLLDALDTVWATKDAQSRQDHARTSQQINGLKQNISNRAMAAIDPSNASIKDEIMASIEQMKTNISDLEKELAGLSQQADADKRRFMEFALGFVENLSENFLSLTPENRKKCKQIIFPAGFYVDANKNVYTPEISALIRLATTKKDAEASDFARMVRVRRL